jgi:hypothetical protein
MTVEENRAESPDLPIGGWLTPPSVVLALAPVAAAIKFMLDVRAMALVSPALFRSGSGLALIAGDLALAVFVTFVAIRFFKLDRTTVWLAPLFLLVTTLWIAAATWLAAKLFNRVVDLRAAGAALLVAAAGIPYFLISKRVRRTFTLSHTRFTDYGVPVRAWQAPVRIVRLTHAEMVKILHHPFFPVALVILSLVTVLGAWAFEPKTTLWGAPHALLLFALGAKTGLKIASILLVIFGSLFFAGEFDKGTIRLLLTRPVARTEVFLAKCLTGLALAALFFSIVLALSFAFGCVRGELGPVWDGEQGLILSTSESISAHATKAIGMSVAGILAAVFLGIVVSTFVESSGFAVAIALTLFIGLDLGLGLVREDQTRFVFSWYPSYAFDTLRSFAEGSSTLWRPAAESRVVLGVLDPPIWLAVPAASALLCSLVGYVMFRARNILA